MAAAREELAKLVTDMNSSAVKDLTELRDKIDGLLTVIQDRGGQLTKGVGDYDAVVSEVLSIKPVLEDAFAQISARIKSTVLAP